MEAKLEKIKELQEIFDSLRVDDELLPIADGLYNSAKIKKIEEKTSKKGNKYVQFTFILQNYQPVVKRTMLFNSNISSALINLAAKLGRSVHTLEKAIEYLNTLNLQCDIEVSGTENDFYEVKVLKTEEVTV